MALGAERLQCWEMGEEEVIAESVVAEVGTLEADAGVAIWRNGAPARLLLPHLITD